MPRLLLALACFVLCTCGSDSEPEVRRIVYWEKWTGFEGQAMQDVVDAFNARERDEAAADPAYVPIEVEMVTVSQLHQKLLVAIAGGDPPDVAGGWTWMVYSYCQKGALADLGPHLAGSDLGPDHYLPAFWDMCRFEGRTWCLPTTPASTALHWNKRLLREAGLDAERPPRTIEELDEYARRLTKWEVTLDETETYVDDQGEERERPKKVIATGWIDEIPDGERRLLQAGFLPTEPGWWSWSWGYHFGGRLYDGEGRITADDPANVRALEWVRSYAERLGVHHLKKFQSSLGQFSSPQNAFMSGRVAMVIQGVWMHNFIDRYAPAMDWSAAPFPHPAGRPELAGANNVEADVILIPRGSEHPDESWAFIEFVQSRRGMERLCLGQRKFSPLTDVSEEFRSGHPHPYIELFRDLASSPNAYSTAKIGVWQEYTRELDDAFNDVMSLRASPQDALDKVQRRVSHSLARERRYREAREGR